MLLLVNRVVNGVTQSRRGGGASAPTGTHEHGHGIGTRLVAADQATGDTGVQTLSPLGKQSLRR